MYDTKTQNLRIIDRIAAFFIATINTALYLMGNFAYQNVLIHANYENFFLIFFWTNTLIVLISRFLNILFVSLNSKHETIIFVNLALLLISLSACSFVFNYWTTTISIVMINFAMSFLDSSVLSYLSRIRKQELVKFWGCGVGFAGLLSAGYSFLCAKYDVSMFWTIISFLFLPFIIGICFYFIHFSPRSHFHIPISKEEEENDDSNTIVEPMLNDQSERPYENPDHADDESLSHSDDMKKMSRIFIFNFSFFHKSWILISNVSIIYFLYHIIRGLIELYGLRHEMTTVYTIPYLNLCFYIGFFISVCSIFAVAIRKIWIFTIVQVLLFIFTCCQTFLHFTKSLILYPLLFIFGICCGFSYINTLYSIMYDNTKHTKQREFVISWSLFILSFFIVLSTVILYFIEKHFYQKK